MSRLEFSKSTMREALTRSGGLCEGILKTGERCNVNLWQKPRHFDHIIPAAIGGDNGLSNCQCLCVQCHAVKTTKRDIPVIAKSKRVADKHNGIRKPKQKIPGRGFAKSEPQRTASRPINKPMFFTRADG